MAAEKVIEVLNELRSAEQAAIRQCVMMRYSVSGPHARGYAAFFKQIAIVEERHADDARTLLEQPSSRGWGRGFGPSTVTF